MKVKIDGPTRDDLIAVPRTALREGDQVWQISKDKTLAITKVDVVRRLPDEVLVKGLKAGDQIIKSRIASPVPGMALRLQAAPDKVAQAADASKAASK